MMYCSLIYSIMFILRVFTFKFLSQITYYHMFLLFDENVCMRVQGSLISNDMYAAYLTAVSNNTRPTHVKWVKIIVESFLMFWTSVLTFHHQKCITNYAFHWFLLVRIHDKSHIS